MTTRSEPHPQCRELLARALLTLGSLLPFWPLLTFQVLYVTDDGFTSDIWNGELPGHVLAGASMRAYGTLHSWTSQLCSGTPMFGGEEPLSLALFSLLSPAAALDAFVLILLSVAAHGSYSLARRMGAGRPGAVLCGIAFAVSGYLVTQLKHLAIIGTVVWLPLGFVLLDAALSERSASLARRTQKLALFGLVFAEQALMGFPQSAYICGLAYGAFALHCVSANVPTAARTRRLLPDVVLPLMAAACVVLLASAAAAVTLLPLFELGTSSDRASGNGFAWATQLHYWPRDALMFLLPYANGDISDGTYTGNHSLFWEDYGYVGVATFLLAGYAVVRQARDRHVRFFALLGVVSYLLVLGPATPLFRLAFELLPGFKLFRFPTRILIVVELCLCVLAALGLSSLERDFVPLFARLQLARVLPLLIFAIGLGTELDLFANQTRQNPMVPAREWLEPPDIVQALQREPGVQRVFTPFHMDFHRSAYFAANGWEKLAPYFAMRDLVQPNSNVYWNVATADCYAGLGPRWRVDVWGDHSRGSLLVYRTIQPNIVQRIMQTKPAFVTLMRTYGVTHVISPFAIPALEPALRFPAAAGHDARLYRVADSARVRVVPRAKVAQSTDAAIATLLEPTFDPDALVVLSDAPASLASPDGPPPSAAERGAVQLTRDDEIELELHVQAPAGGFLVLGDTFLTGWTARVDEQPATIYRANLSVRAVRLSPGNHRVVFSYRSLAHARGAAMSAAAGGALLCLLLGSLFQLTRERKTSIF